MPTLHDLQSIEAEFLLKCQEYRQIISQLPLASADSLDIDTNANIVAEGAFIRYFTLWERSVEKSFLYFCQGGVSLTGVQPVCRLTNCDEVIVRKILTAGQKYLDWAVPGNVRDRAKLFFEDGKPFHDPMAGNAQILSDAQKIRNVIAHDSLEAWNSYTQVQRNNFQTERNFPMSPGQMLRARKAMGTKIFCEIYFDAISQVFAAILRP